MFIMIGAMSKNNCVGKNNSLPWRIPSDLQFFKRNTKRKTVIMGWNTYLSLHQRPLPNRENIVLIKDDFQEDDLKGYKTDGFLFLTYGEIIDYELSMPEMEFFVIGGPKTWDLFRGKYDKAIISRVQVDIEDGDAFVDDGCFEGLVLRNSVHPPNEIDITNDDYRYMIWYYQKK